VWKDGTGALLMRVAEVMVYWPALHGDFVWDYGTHIPANLTLRSLRDLP